MRDNSSRLKRKRNTLKINEKQKIEKNWKTEKVENKKYKRDKEWVKNLEEEEIGFTQGKSLNNKGRWKRKWEKISWEL